MANLINPIEFSPINVPTEIATDSIATSLDLYVGSSTVEDLYFKGKIYKKPGATNIGVNLSSYLSVLPNPDFTPKITGNILEELQNYIVPYKVKLKNINTSVYDFTGRVCYKNPKIEDWFKIKDGLTYGRLGEYTKANKIPKLTNGKMFIGQTTAPNWTSVTASSGITLSTFPLTQSRYSIKASTPLSNVSFYAHSLTTSTKRYQVKFDISIYTQNRLIVAGDIVNVNAGWQTVTKEFLGSALSSSVPLIRISLENEFDVASLRNITFEEIPYNWKFPGTVYDYMLHNRINTFGTIYDRPFNKVVKGAPLALYMMNSSSASKTLIASNDYSNVVDFSTGINENIIQTLTAYKAYRLEINTGDYKYIGVSLQISGLDNRYIYFEVLDESYKYQLYYINREGGLDFIPMQGYYYKSSDNTRFKYKSNFRTYNGSNTFEGNIDKQVNNTYSITSKEVYKLNSYNETEDTYKYLEELISSPKVWLYDGFNDSVYAVDVVDNNFEYKKFNTNQIFNFEVTVEKQLLNYRR